ncbi:hypothetical protein MKX08_002656 [Trichoderma sp. CBMAI-0020]|nr:hypothetical protein MKX08_002656 [Trichoderma sp. CBMAI-0020]
MSPSASEDHEQFRTPRHVPSENKIRLNSTRCDALSDSIQMPEEPTSFNEKLHDESGLKQEAPNPVFRKLGRESKRMEK